MSEEKFVYNVDIQKILNDNNISITSNNPNIIQKDNRPYYVSVSLNNEYSAFIPIRTKLPHKYGFITKIKGKQRSGLDYTKSMIVETQSIATYLIQEASISFGEYQKIKANQTIITKNYQEFIFELYIPISEKTESERNVTEKQIYSYSSLQYFDTLLKNIKPN